MKILFVCTGNAFRSPVAEALLKKYKPDIEVDSAGTNPSIPISTSARNYLLSENAEQFLKQKPESVYTKKLKAYELIIVMQPEHKFQILRKCPEYKEKIVVWNIPDPYFHSIQDSVKIFRKIKENVKTFIKTL